MMGAGLCLELSCEFKGLQVTRRHYAETRVGRKGRCRHQLAHLVSLELWALVLLVVMYVPLSGSASSVFIS